MKKSSLLITAAASLVCLVSCNQPAKPQGQKYDGLTVMTDICKLALGIKNPKLDTDFYYDSSDETYYVYDQVPEDVTAEDQLMDMCYEKFNAIKNAISYLDVNYEPEADEAGDYQAGFVTKNEETVAYVASFMYESGYYWEIDVKPNPVQKGWVSAEFLKEKLDVEGVEVPAPTGEHTFDYIFRKASGTTPRYVWVQAEGENLEAAYKAQLAAANWTVEEDDEGGFFAADPNQKVAIEVYGYDADAASQQEALTNFYIFNYEEYMAEPAESPDNIQQVVLDVFNAYVSEENQTEDAEQFWSDEAEMYMVGIGCGTLTEEQSEAFIDEYVPEYLVAGKDWGANSQGYATKYWVTNSGAYQVYCFLVPAQSGLMAVFQFYDLTA